MPTKTRQLAVRESMQYMDSTAIMPKKTWQSAAKKQCSSLQYTIMPTKTQHIAVKEINVHMYKLILYDCKCRKKDKAQHSSSTVQYCTSAAKSQCSAVL